MGAELHELSLLKHGDLVAEPAGREPVGDVERALLIHHGAEARVHLRFGDGVEGGGRLVEDDERGVLVERAGDGELLRLAAGEIHTALLHLVERLVQPLRLLFRPFERAGLPQAVLHAGLVIVRGGGHVLAQRQRQDLKILEYDGEQAAELVAPVFAHVAAVEQDAPLRGVIEAAQQLDKRRLAAAVAAHKGVVRALFQPQVQPAQRPLLRAGVAEAHIFAHDLPVAGEIHRQRAVLLVAVLVRVVALADEIKVFLAVRTLHADVLHGVDEHAHALRELRDGAGHLHDAAHREQPGQGAHAHGQVGQAGDGLRERAAHAAGEGAQLRARV